MPQMVVLQFMAGTIIEDGFCVKAPRSAPRRRSVNASVTRPSHCRGWDPNSRAFWPVWGDVMRFVIAAAALASVLFGAASAQAEKRIFIIANNADGYGVDRCLASGA